MIGVKNIKIDEAKEKNLKEIERCQQEFDMRISDLINRLNKTHKNMNYFNYMELASDIELFAMTFTQISEELRLKDSVRTVLATLEK